MLVIVLVNGAASGFIFYTESKHSCECGPDWRRAVIKMGGLIIAGLAVVAYFTPVVKILRMIPLLGGLFLLGVLGLIIIVLYCIQKYLKDVNDDESCDCIERNRLQTLHNIIGWTSFTTLIITACIVAFLIFYLF